MYTPYHGTLDASQHMLGAFSESEDLRTGSVLSRTLELSSP